MRFEPTVWGEIWKEIGDSNLGSASQICEPVLMSDGEVSAITWRGSRVINRMFCRGGARLGFWSSLQNSRFWVLLGRDPIIYVEDSFLGGRVSDQISGEKLVLV